jgi:hypothetical protein
VRYPLLAFTHTRIRTLHLHQPQLALIDLLALLHPLTVHTVPQDLLLVALLLRQDELLRLLLIQLG